jgi:hypothetical protein
MRRVFVSSFSLVMPFLVSPAWSAENSAHALAQKFAIEESKQAQPKSAAPAKAAPAPAQAKSTPQPKSPPAPSAQDDEREMLAAARAEAEARKTQETSRPASTTVAAAPSTPAATAAASPAQPPAAPPAQKSAPSTGSLKATVLVVLSQTGAHGTTFKTFDPIICFSGNCFISTGANSDARSMTRDEALSTKSAVTTGAGACAGQMGCVFRGVSFEQDAPLQIIDLGLVNHKLHDPLEAKVDATCVFGEGDLTCKKPLTAPDYRVWIVPEAVAAQAGPDKLASALDDELPEENGDRQVGVTARQVLRDRVFGDLAGGTGGVLHRQFQPAAHRLAGSSKVRACGRRGRRHPADPEG